MIELTGIYDAANASTGDSIIRFTGFIDNKTLLDDKRKEDPEGFYSEIGKLFIDQFNDHENWI
jgi:hypothetical protein